MPELNWVGKDKVITHHLDVPCRVLERQYSFDEAGQHEVDNGSENMVIHGDNLEALKALLPHYEGKVDVIYIDPPYNTGKTDWVYNDNVDDPRIRKWLGRTVGPLGEDLSRHDKWLCMMYPRLRLLHRLLAPTGAIFISIDDNEVAQLRLICDEIFGERCFVANISWQRTYSTRNDSKGIPAEVDHLLVFSKQPGWNPNKLDRTPETDKNYKNPDNDRVAWASSDAFAPGATNHQGMVYAVQHPFTGELIYPPYGRCWGFEQSEVLRIFSEWTEYELRDLGDAERRAAVCGLPVDKVRSGVKGIVLSKSMEEVRADAQAVYDRGRWPVLYFTDKGRGGVRRKTYIDSVGGLLPTNYWSHEEAGHTDEAKKEIRAIFDGRVAFDTPKPARLVERILKVASKPGDLILDSFAGSGTTAHAVLNLNKQDRGGRRFILVEIDDYAEDVTAERVKRVICGYKDIHTEERVLFERKLTVSAIRKGSCIIEEAERVYEEACGKYTKVSRPRVKTKVKGKSGTAFVQVIATQEHDEDVSGTGGSFSFYELGEPLLLGGQLNTNVPVSRMRDYIWFTETQTPFADPALSDHPYFLGVHDRVAYHFIYEPDRLTTLGHCFINSLAPEVRAEGLLVYADVCALPPEQLDAHNITFRKIPRDITRL